MKNASLDTGARGIVKDFAFLGGACLIGMALAAAAIGFAPETTIDPGLRTLAAQTAPQQAPAGDQQLMACRTAPRSGTAAAPSAVHSVVCEE